MMSKAIRPGWKQGESNIQKSVDLKSNWSHFKSNISEMVNPFSDVIIFFPEKMSLRRQMYYNSLNVMVKHVFDPFIINA